jgi:hypothetical protein
VAAERGIARGEGRVHGLDDAIGGDRKKDMLQAGAEQIAARQVPGGDRDAKRRDARDDARAEFHGTAAK